MEELLEYQSKINDLTYTINILMWDLRINAPKDAKENLIELISRTQDDLIKLSTSKKYGDLLNDVINSEEFTALSIEEQNVIKKCFNSYEKTLKVPKKFLSEYLKLQNTCNVVWEKAKKENNYSLYKPELEKMIDMTKKYYSYINPDAKNIYDVMLNDYSYGINSKTIDMLFDELKEGILPLIPKGRRKEEYYHDNSKEELLECAKYLLHYIGFDNNKGILGIYPHGYTEKMTDTDVRIAFDKRNTPVNFVSTIIHEGGHGILEQNINPKLTVFEDGGLNNLYDLHESQSRFFENILGRRKSFWIPIYDAVKIILHLDLTLDEFVKKLNEVSCGLIRTDADELTYCMHIILRYEIERDLFNGKLTVDDLPKVWKEKMKEYLGVDVMFDKDGLMQDVHWSEGGFGYFPSYLLGSIYDGMFLNQMEEDLGNIDELLAKGKIKEITNYLINNIYVNGGAYSSKEVIEKLCHKELSSKPLIDYFKKKYM